MILAQIAFYIFSFFLVLSAFAVITSKNPVYSVLFLILAFFNSAGIFVLLGAEFIAMLMVIVYVGAVAVLFLFVVMMLNIKPEKLKAGFMKNLPLGIVVAIITFSELILVINVSEIPQESRFAANVTPVEITNTEAIGMILYTDYLYAFQISGIILLVAMVSAIVLTLRTRKGVRKQNIFNQVNRKRDEGVKLVNVQSGKGV